MNHKLTCKPQNMILVYEIFDHAVSSYDNLIDFMWLGIHRSWRKKLIARLAPAENTKLIDVAGGTGKYFSEIYDVIDVNKRLNTNILVVIFTVLPFNFAKLQERIKK
jgi:ubiquinone/menaquinone biosynthesis C-methylase UbiE